jgi:hypothetical protein
MYIIGGFAFIAIVLQCVVHAVEQTRKGQQLLENWAHRNGYRILERQLCNIFRGPFLANSSKIQQVFQVTVKEAEGKTRNGYVRCGSYWRGVNVDQVDVCWDSSH